ncbi:MAG: ROK family protein [Ilumatobacteraceae bacterium]
MVQVVAVVDVGGTSIKCGSVGLDDGRSDTIDVGSSLPTLSNESADIVLDRLGEAAQTALDFAGPDAVGLAIAICGPFDVENGISRMRGVHKFEHIYGIDMQAAIRDRTSIGDRPIRFARDAESAGTGEALAGAGRTFDRVLTVTVGTGLGTCLTDGARPVPVVNGDGIEHLGMRETPWGRADDVLSAYGLANRLGVAMTSLPAAVDDPANLSIVSDHGTRLGTFLAPVVDELGAQVVVVGGGLSAAFHHFGPALHAAIGTTPVHAATLGSAAPLLGAAHLTFRPDLHADR